MQTQVFEGYFENGNFYNNKRQVMIIPEKFKVHITLYNEKVNFNAKSEQLEKRPFSEMFGEWNDSILMSDDFDEPLEEMRDYM